MVEYILLYGRIDCQLSLRNLLEICTSIAWKFSQLFDLTIPSKDSQAKVSKGMDFMCDGICGGGGAKWFVALLPEVGKIDTRLWSSVAESPHNQGR